MNLSVKNAVKIGNCKNDVILGARSWNGSSYLRLCALGRVDTITLVRIHFYYMTTFHIETDYGSVISSDEANKWASEAL